MTLIFPDLERKFNLYAEGDGDGDGGGDAGGSGGTGGDGSGAAGAGGDNADGSGAAGAGGDKPTHTLAQWKDSLPEDVRTHPSLAKITNLEGMTRSFLHSQRLIGKDPATLLEMPGVDDTAGRRAVLTRLGLPGTGDGYKLEPVKDAPESFSLDKPLAKGFIERGHKLGVLPEQMQGIYSGFVEDLVTAEKEAVADADVKTAENIRKLEAEWGAAFDQRVAAANFGIDKLSEKGELLELLNEHGLGAHPVILKAFAKVGQMVAEDASGDGGGDPDFSTKDAPNEATAKGKALLQQALNEKDPTEKRRLNLEAQKFFKMANPKMVGAV